MKTANDIVLKALGALLIIAGTLKGWQLLTEPVANNSIWTWRPFMVLQVDFELALGIWLLSGLYKKAAWLTVLLCFSAFSLITLYKGITGAESCGCFGSVHVNPWVTLFAIDVPSVIALLVFRPVLSFMRRRESIRALVHEFFTPLPSIPQFTITTCLALLILGVTTPILAFNEPAKITRINTAFKLPPIASILACRAGFWSISLTKRRKFGTLSNDNMEGLVRRPMFENQDYYYQRAARVVITLVYDCQSRLGVFWSLLKRDKLLILKDLRALRNFCQDICQEVPIRLKSACEQVLYSDVKKKIKKIKFFFGGRKSLVSIDKAKHYGVVGDRSRAIHLGGVANG